MKKQSVLSASRSVCGRGGNEDGPGGRGGPVGCLVMVEELDSYRAIFRLATRERKTGSSSTGHHAIVGQKKKERRRAALSRNHHPGSSHRLFLYPALQKQDANLLMPRWILEGRWEGMINIED